MVDQAAAIEDALFDTFGLGAFRQGLADLLGCFAVAGVALEAGLAGGGGGQGDAGRVVDQLRVDVAVAAVDGQAGAFGGAADMLADAVMLLGADALRSTCLYMISFLSAAGKDYIPCPCGAANS